MRIVGGDYRGRRLETPSNDTIRPTTDRTREALFNILTNAFAINWRNTRILDLFSGTGALGLEALSRGAPFAVFVEQSTQGRGLVRSNIEALGLTGRTKLFRRDATRLGAVGTLAPFQLVFADPPYAKGLGERAAASLAQGGWMAPSALFVLEEKRGSLPVTLPDFVALGVRAMGDTEIGIFQYAAG
ncbi:MAG: 16S rRNA (guanine(966)-N(2))-methyltransferase RsmD [Pseudomonadota bacterium]